MSLSYLIAPPVPQIYDLISSKYVDKGWCPKNLKLRGSLCLTPMEIHQSVWIRCSDHFWKKKMKLKGQWPLDDFWPPFCRGHMCDSTQVLCPSPMQIHANTRKLKAKGQWPQQAPGDLWPQAHWGHTCNSTQGLLCPTLINCIEACEYNDFLQKLNQISATPLRH